MVKRSSGQDGFFLLWRLGMVVANAGSGDVTVFFDQGAAQTPGTKGEIHAAQLPPGGYACALDRNRELMITKR
jgi:hypothetical protein